MQRDPSWLRTAERSPLWLADAAVGRCLRHLAFGACRPASPVSVYFGRTPSRPRLARKPIQDYLIDLIGVFLLRPVATRFEHMDLEIGYEWPHALDMFR